MKILAVIPKYEPNSEKKGSHYFLPLGIMYISAYLKKKGFDVRSLNLNHYEDSKLQKVLEEEAYDVVCTGGLFTEIIPIAAVINTTKQVQPKAKIVLGGALASGDPEFTIKNLCPDFLVLGEGEVTMAELVTAIKNGSDFKKNNGIAFLENETFVKTPSRESLIADLDSHPYPDYEGFEFGRFLNHHKEKNESYVSIMDVENRRVANIISSRNCAAKCTFCFRLMTGGYRPRSIDNVMEEIKYLIEKYDINEVGLVDEMFALKNPRIYEFCEKIKPLGIRWQCQLRVSFIEKDLLIAMKESGCYFISYGFESGSKTVLKNMKKGVNVTQIENAIRLTSEAGIAIQGNFIFGDPSETLDTMNETIRFRKKFPTIIFGWGLIIPYPGTVLYNNLKERGEFKNLVEFYKAPSDVFNAFPMNMTKLSSNDYKYMCRKVWLEGKISFVPAKVLSVKKGNSQYALIDFQCPNCLERHQGIKININGKLLLFCKKCYQKVRFYRSDITFDPYDKIRYVYHRLILRPMLFSSKTHKFFSPLIDLLEGHGKIGRLVKRLLRGG